MFKGSDKIDKVMSKGKAHIIGVCGTAMGGVAVILKELGFDVSGSDSMFFPPISVQLSKYGVKTFQFSPENIKDKDIVVVGNSVGRDNTEVLEAQAIGKKLYSYPDIINEFFGSKDFFVITGTHGKTTTTSLASYVLWRAGYNPSFLVGGIPINFGVSAKVGSGDIFVIEGDEYNTSFFDKRPKFFHFRPKRAVIGPVEVDHVDMYQSFEDYKKAFSDFAKMVEHRLSYFNSQVVQEITSDSGVKQKFSYYYENPADFYPTKIEISDGKYNFRINGYDIDFNLRIFGRHNILNSIAVFALTNDIIRPDEFSEYLQDFQGVKRRLEVLYSSRNFYVVDDFAHHPTEIESGIRSLREFFDTIILAFEPRSYTSRTKVHQEGFKKAFELADAVFIGKIFREEKVPQEKRLDPFDIVSYLQSKGIYAVYSESVADKIIDYIANLKIRDKKIAVVFMTSGDFYGEKDRFIANFRKFIEL